MEVVTAWRVVKRRMAKGAAGRTGGGRNGIRVEGRSRGRRGVTGEQGTAGATSRGPRRSRSSRSLSPYRRSLRHSLRRFPVFSSSLLLHPGVSLPLPRPLSFPRASAFLAVPILPRSLSRSPQRCVFRGKRPGLVDGPSHGLQLSPNPSRPLSPPHPSPSCLPSLSLFGPDLPFSSSLTAGAGSLRRAPTACSSPPYIPSEEKEEERRKEERRGMRAKRGRGRER